MKDVKRSKRAETSRKPGSTVIDYRVKREGNNRFNFRRAEDMLNTPATVGDWPKPENEHSVLIGELQHHNCQMPLWNVIGPDSKYCGRPRIQHEKVMLSPYCFACHKLAYQPR